MTTVQYVGVLGMIGLSAVVNVYVLLRLRGDLAAIRRAVTGYRADLD